MMNDNKKVKEESSLSFAFECKIQIGKAHSHLPFMLEKPAPKKQRK